MSSKKMMVVPQDMFEVMRSKQRHEEIAKPNLTYMMELDKEMQAALEQNGLAITKRLRYIIKF